MVRKPSHLTRNTTKCAPNKYINLCSDDEGDEKVAPPSPKSLVCVYSRVSGLGKSCDIRPKTEKKKIIIDTLDALHPTDDCSLDIYWTPVYDNHDFESWDNELYSNNSSSQKKKRRAEDIDRLQELRIDSIKTAKLSRKKKRVVHLDQFEEMHIDLTKTRKSEGNESDSLIISTDEDAEVIQKSNPSPISMGHQSSVSGFEKWADVILENDIPRESLIFCVSCGKPNDSSIKTKCDFCECSLIYINHERCVVPAFKDPNISVYRTLINTGTDSMRLGNIVDLSTLMNTDESDSSSGDSDVESSPNNPNQIVNIERLSTRSRRSATRTYYPDHVIARSSRSIKKMFGLAVDFSFFEERQEAAEVIRQSMPDIMIDWNNMCKIVNQFQVFSLRRSAKRGLGLYAAKDFKQGHFVISYKGELLTMEEQKQREKFYKTIPNLRDRCYFFYFRYDGSKGEVCVDATLARNDFGLARYVNHSRKSPNMFARKLKSPFGVWELAFYANKDIEMGQELLIDYGDRAFESIDKCPWLND